MKKVFFVFAFLFSFYNTTISQSFMGGVTAGLATSQVDGDTYSGYHRAGFLVGGYVKHRLSDKTDFQLEMRYIQRGSYKRPNQDAGDFSEYSLKLNYIEVPALLHFKYKPRIIFETGLSFAYLADVYEGNEIGEYPEVLKKPFNKFDFNFILGGYYKISDRILFNIRYDYSFIPIRTDISGEVRYLFLRGQFNNSLCFSFYYLLGKKSE